MISYITDIAVMMTFMTSEKPCMLCTKCKMKGLEWIWCLLASNGVQCNQIIYNCSPLCAHPLLGIIILYQTSLGDSCANNQLPMRTVAHTLVRTSFRPTPSYSQPLVTDNTLKA